MPEVRRGSSLQISRRASDNKPSQVDSARLPAPIPTIPDRPETHHQSSEPAVVSHDAASSFSPRSAAPAQARAQSLDVGSRLQQNHRPRQTSTGNLGPPARSKTEADMADGRRSLSYGLRPAAGAYYDSRAGTHREWKRRGKTLQEYYDENPSLLPQLPFTWHHGRKRWKLFMFAFIAVIDASAVPIALYYGLTFGADVEGWITFAVVTTIWGGPAYFEAGMRTLRLIKKERFFRPLGTDSRWSFDLLTWISALTIGVVTTLFIVGSAPHIVWLRVLCMPGPAILYCLGGSLGLITLYHMMGWKAPFRFSSTAKGEKVLPGAYYFMEDVVAVNAKAGRPYREALAARYKASPRFQRMLFVQSVFWSVPAIVLAIGLTVVAVIPPIPPEVAYGICWAVPFLWASVWGLITIRWCKRDMRRERLEWEGDEECIAKLGSPRSEGNLSAEATA